MGFCQTKGKVLLPEFFTKSISKPITPDGNSNQLSFETSVQNRRVRKEMERKQAVIYALTQCEDDRKKAVDHLGILVRRFGEE